MCHVYEWFERCVYLKLAVVINACWLILKNVPYWLAAIGPKLVHLGKKNR